MAEGPLVHHYTKRLREILEGKKVRIEFQLFEIEDHRFCSSTKGLRASILFRFSYHMI